ncbi:MAG TPA: alpha/beta hydrolase [Chitinophaga sp.]|uniref:alpha/beta fold hydrolase n=1 Tax=Chitinophaga sp. TaxID=1869181 RepID=UPI002C8E7686|nr:alpha/beta hydrolase [Chitinophaga sp.]HVI47295.1 alpha/beta hydrolase [Chitinophaga sp.]
MKIRALSFILLLCLASTSYGQSKDTTDKYAKARAIIIDRDRILTPNGVQENYEVPVGGVKQWVFVRGYDKENPIILFVHGGPASPLAPVAWMYQRPIEEYFTVVNYDQRASGKTYRTNDTTGLGETIHIDRYVDDAVELAEFIRKKYNKKKLVLAGHSWGTIVAMRAALKRPDLFYAYVGIGQAINVMDNERLSFEFGVKEATRLKNEEALKELQSIAPYPGDKPVTRDRIIIARKWPQYYGGLTAYREESMYFYNGPLLSPDYERKDVRAIDDGNIFTLGRILPEFLAVDFKKVKTFPIPVLMFMGRHDYTTPSVPTEAWLQQVKAPYKKGIWFEHSSHMIPMEEPGKVFLSLVQYVLPLTQK